MLCRLDPFKWFGFMERMQSSLAPLEIGFPVKKTHHMTSKHHSSFLPLTLRSVQNKPKPDIKNTEFVFASLRDAVC